MKFDAIIVEIRSREHEGKVYKSIVLEDRASRPERLTAFVEMNLDQEDHDLIPHLKPDVPITVIVKSTDRQFQGVSKWIGRIDRASIGKK